MKIDIFPLFSLFLLTFLQESNCLEFDLALIIKSFLSQFANYQITLPIILEGTQDLKVRLVKTLGRQSLKIKFVKWDTEDLSPKLMLVIQSDSTSVLKKFIKIDEQFYFIKENGELLENYHVNGRHIEVKLGQFLQNGQFLKSTSNSNVWKRRADFHGINFIGLVEEWWPQCTIKNQDQPFLYKDREVFELSAGDQVNGLAIDFLEMLASTTLVR